MHAMTGVEAAKASVPTGSAPPPPPPAGNTVTISNTNTIVSNTRLGMTSVHNQIRNTTTKNLLATAAYIQNQHLIGFGSATNPQPGAGAAYNWSFLDSTFGYPTATTGYFSVAPERCLTLCGCPPHMRSPKTGLPWDPMGVRSGTQLTSLSDYSPPHSSWFQEFADLCAAAAARYPHIKYFQVWNELKNFYFSTQYTGSNLVPTGSGLPAGPGGGNRWWFEGYTAMFNKIYVAIKAVRPDAMIGGPYAVLRSFSWDPSNDSQYWANDAFPYSFDKAWGYADKKELAVFEYFIKNCSGCDLITSDIKNLTNDQFSSGYFSAGGAAIPVTPQPTNKWTTNPDGGYYSQYFKEGQIVGAWNMGQKQADFVAWVRSLGASGAAYQRSVCDARTVPVCFAEWYAYGQRNQFRSLDPRTGNYWASETVSSHAEEAAAFAWQYAYAVDAGVYYCMAWKPEGTVQGTEVDPGDSNPLALWYQNGAAGGLSLAPTELKPVMDGLVANFPPGTQLKTFSSNMPEVKGLVSATKIMIVSRAKVPLTFSLIDPSNTTSVHTLQPYDVQFISR